jgi:hypothetical protein
MKDFTTVSFDPARVNKELRELDRLLKSRGSLSERADLQPFFKKREQLPAFLGTYTVDIWPATHLAYELPPPFAFRLCFSLRCPWPEHGSSQPGCLPLPRHVTPGGAAGLLPPFPGCTQLARSKQPWGWG